VAERCCTEFHLIDLSMFILDGVDAMSHMSEFENRVFSVPEAALHLRISRAFLYQLIANKSIKPFKLGARSLITGREISRFIAGQ
jgi:excisionase family DNA binding protein